MREIHTIDPGRWEKVPDRPGLVRQVGMIKAQEAFDKLEAHLNQVGLMPDEYFIPSPLSWDKKTELPNYHTAVCHTNWGSSEGIYIDISLEYKDEDNKNKSLRFATGKTLGSSGDDFLRMSRIAAECSMMLNGWGDIVKVNEEPVKEMNSLLASDGKVSLDSVIKNADEKREAQVASSEKLISNDERDI